jgi:hypothetical protein
MATVQFTDEASRRIAAAVRKVERTPTSLVGDRIPRYEGEQSFWAILLGEDLSGRWTFQRVAPDPSALNPAAFMLFDTDAVRWGFEGDAQVWAAREVNENRNVPTLSVVQMTFCGYDPAGQPAFVFSYTPAPTDVGMPIHDHRDNLNGGLAFAVLHPGTLLPQSQYAI